MSFTNFEHICSHWNFDHQMISLLVYFKPGNTIHQQLVRPNNPHYTTMVQWISYVQVVKHQCEIEQSLKDCFRWHIRLSSATYEISRHIW